MPARVRAVAPCMAQVTMYTTTWCGYCFRLKSQLKRAGVAYDEVDIEEQPDAADLVEIRHTLRQIVNVKGD